MQLTPLETLITIIAVALGTMVTRFTPFILFPENKEVPEFVGYLGKVLPAATMGLLVVFCFKSVSFYAFPFALPEIVASVAVIVFHLWKRNVLFSIGGGTAVYMILIQTVF
ncbi:MAG: AzlD domain-containing protein [Lachnospiraceae bacterium]|nr:AzlD domain-containing protein [Lachnospiraceae bacterium]